MSRKGRRRWQRPLAAILAMAVLAPLMALFPATPSSAEAVFPPRYERTIGGTGRPGVFAWGVQHNPVTDEILVSDYLNFQIRRYDLNGNHLGDFWRDGAVGQPYTIAVDPADGAIYVAELKDNPLTVAIAKYDKDGTFLSALPVSYSAGPRGAVPTSPQSRLRAFYTVWMTVEEDTGDLFVLDSHYTITDDYRPYVIQLDWIDQAPGDTTAQVNVKNWWEVNPPTLPNPCNNPGTCVPRAYGIDISDSDVIWLTDAQNRVGYRYAKDGTFLGTYGAGRFGGDMRGVVVNEAIDRVYAVDAESSQVDVFRQDGSYVSSFSSEGNGPGQFAGGGRAIDIDGQGNVWVGDFGGFETEKFSPTGQPLLRAPVPARKPPAGLLGQPRDVAVDDQTGDVWVADAWNQRFQRFNANGQLLGSWGERGPGGPFDMNYPRSIAIDPVSRRIWIANERGHHIQVYNYPTSNSAAPTYVRQIGRIGQDNTNPGFFRWPADIEFYSRPDGTRVAVIGDRMDSSVKIFDATTYTELLKIARPNHGTAVDPATGHIYVVNPSNDRIEVYDQAGAAVNLFAHPTTGSAVNWFGSSGTGNGQVRDPVDAVIAGGTLYVSDESISRVTAFGLDGSYIGRIGSTYGSNVYDFKGAIGIDANADGSKLYVTDTGNDRIQVFDTTAPRVYEAVPPSVPTVSSPAQQANLPLGAVTMTGAATDNVAVGHVEISVQDADTGKWWNAANQSWVDAKTAANAAWSGASASNVQWRWTFLGVNAGGRYIAELKTRDHNANVSQLAIRTFAMPGATAPTPPVAPVIDTERPNGLQDAPTAGQTFPRAPLTISGTATDNVGVTSVRLAIKRADGRYLSGYSGSAQPSFGTAFVWHEATLDTPGGTTTGWSLPFTPANSGGTYTTLVEARDAAGHVDGSKPQVTFTTTNVPPDTTPADTAITGPVPGSAIDAAPVDITGTATDNTAVGAVKVAIQRSDTRQFWTGTGWSAEPATVDATLATPGARTSEWSYRFAPAISAGFTVTATAVDTGGAADATPAVTDFTLTTTPADVIDPDGTVGTPTANQAFPAGPVTFSGQATDNVGVASVQVALRDRSTQRWWNGTAWVTGFSWFATAALEHPGAPSTAWSYTWAPPVAGGDYTLQVKANDAAGNGDQQRPNVFFSVAAGDPGSGPDVTAPDGTVAVPTAGQAFPSGPVTLTGAATDNVGVTGVQLAIRDRGTQQWWTGTGWSASFRWFTHATLDAAGAPSTRWSYTWDPPAPGNYLVQVRADDAAGLFDQTRPSVNFSVG